MDVKKVLLGQNKILPRGIHILIVDMDVGRGHCNSSQIL